MSLDTNTYVPDINDSIVPRWLERMNGLGMHCEIHPEFSFLTQEGFLPFKIRLETSAHKELIGVDFLSGFEFYCRDFSLARELKEMAGKRGIIGRLLGKTPPRPYWVNPEVDRRLRPCTKVLNFVWGSADLFELRLATISSAVLAELTGGVSCYPADNIWYDTATVVADAIRESQRYEDALRPREVQVHRFEGWDV